MSNDTLSDHENLPGCIAETRSAEDLTDGTFPEIPLRESLSWDAN
jgi:hypothetical protein